MVTALVLPPSCGVIGSGIFVIGVHPKRGPTAYRLGENAPIEQKFFLY